MEGGSAVLSIAVLQREWPRGRVGRVTFSNEVTVEKLESPDDPADAGSGSEAAGTASAPSVAPSERLLGDAEKKKKR